MATESLLITCLPDGTYHVKETEEDQGGNPPIDQSFKSPDEVMQVVTQFLQGGDSQSGPDSQMDAGDTQSPDDSDDASAGAGASSVPTAGKGPAMASAWNKEAATRGPSGMKN